MTDHGTLASGAPDSFVAGPAPAREGPRISWTERGLRIIAAAVLALIAWQLPAARKAFIAAPSGSTPSPARRRAGLGPADAAGQAGPVSWYTVDGVKRDAAHDAVVDPVRARPRLEVASLPTVGRCRCR